MRIQGPGIAGAAGSTNPNPCNTTGANAYSGPVNDCIQTNNFVLVGKKSTTAGVDVTRATYDKSATSTQIQVLANSKAGQDIVVQDGDNGPGPGRLFRTTPLRADGTGHYMARVACPARCRSRSTSSTAATSPSTVKHVDLTDKRHATAVYHTTKGTGGGDKLHVTASSSDSASRVGAHAPGLRRQGARRHRPDRHLDPRASGGPVTVKSPNGGSVTVPVDRRRPEPRPAAADRQRRPRPDRQPGREGDPRRQRLRRRHRLASAGAAPPASRSPAPPRQPDVHRADQRDLAHVHADRQERHRDEDRRRRRQGQPGQRRPGPRSPRWAPRSSRTCPSRSTARPRSAPRSTSGRRWRATERPSPWARTRPAPS